MSVLSIVQLARRSNANRILTRRRMQVEADAPSVAFPGFDRPAASLADTIRRWSRLLLMAVLAMGMIRNASGEPFVSLAETPRQSSLHLNGLTWHIQRRGLNEVNWGIGGDIVRYRSESRHSWLDAWTIAQEGDVFLDSHRNWGASLGFSARRPLGRHLLFGLNSGLIYEKGYHGTFGVPVLPFVLPFLQSNLRSKVNFRLTYCPPVQPSFHVLMLQCVIRFGEGS